MALDEESESDCNAYNVMVQCSDGGHHLLDQMSIEQPARPNEQPVADRDEVGTLLALPRPCCCCPIYTHCPTCPAVGRERNPTHPVKPLPSTLLPDTHCGENPTLPNDVRIPEETCCSFQCTPCSTMCLQLQCALI